MKEYLSIQKAEGTLWSKVFDFKMLSDDALLTFDCENPDNPNSNQLFFWGESVLPSSDILRQAKDFCINKSIHGYWRSVEVQSHLNAALSESYMVSSDQKSENLQTEKPVQIKYLSSMSEDVNFLPIFCKAFDLDTKFAEGFSKRMENIASKILGSQFFISSIDGVAVSVGGLFPMDGFNFLMNFGTDPQHQKKGYAKLTLSQVTQDSKDRVVFRSSNPVLLNHVAPACGYQEVVCTNIYPIEKSILE